MPLQTRPADLIWSERMLTELFETSNLGLCVLDEQLRYLTLTSSLASSHGTSVDSHLGKHIGEILGNVAPQVEPAILNVLATGRPIMNLEVAGALPTRPDGGRWVCNYFPVADSDSRVTGVVALVVELAKDIDLQQIPSACPANTVLRSWKEIACYMGTCVKTVQRWEQSFGLPIRRVAASKGSVVFAGRDEIDRWLHTRKTLRDDRPNQ